LVCIEGYTGLNTRVQTTGGIRVEQIRSSGWSRCSEKTGGREFRWMRGSVRENRFEVREIQRRKQRNRNDKGNQRYWKGSEKDLIDPVLELHPVCRPYVSLAVK